VHSTVKLAACLKYQEVIII